MASVRAVVYDRYGPPEVLRLEELERPLPGDDEILVRVHATTVNRTDCHRRGAYPFLWRLLLGLRRPRRRVLGMEFAGVVEAVGSVVDEFAVGDEVFGMKGFGAHAELLCIPVGKLVAHKPANVTFEQAAAVPDGAVNALTCLRRAGVGPGMHVLVYGASGSIGTATVQLAKHMGARVTAVCNTSNVDLVRSLGPDEVLDYTRGDDFTKNREAYDVVVDAVGKHSFMRSRHALKTGGIYVSTDGLRNLALAPISRLGRRRVALPIARAAKDDVLLLERLLEAGDYRAVIDRSYRLEDIVAASRYVETQQKTGNVVLTVGGDRTA
jgi:NADPH:quinone reductase-like Zn-dependent oxidoreductase